MPHVLEVFGRSGIRSIRILRRTMCPPQQADCAGTLRQAEVRLVAVARPTQRARQPALLLRNAQPQSEGKM